MHRHLMNKVISSIQLFILGLSIPSAIATTVCSNETVYADSTSSSSNSSAFNQLQDLIGKQNNVYNPKFPDSVKNAISSKSGALSYNEKAQVAITYSILENGYPADYSSLYKTGDNQIGALNKVLPGLSIPDMGTDNFVQDLASGQSEGGGHQDEKKGPDKAEEIATSTFPTDMSKDEIAKWSNDPKNKDLANLVNAYAKDLSNNALSAVGVDMSGAKVVAWADDHVYGNSKWKDLVNSAVQKSKAFVNHGKTTSSWQAGVVAGDTKGFKPGINSKLQNFQDNVTCAIEYDLLSGLKAQGSNIKSKSDLQKWLNKQTADNPGGIDLDSKNSWASVLPNFSKDWGKIGETQGYPIIGMRNLNSNGSGTTAMSKDTAISTFKNEAYVISPTVVNSMSSQIKGSSNGSFLSWVSHFKTKMNAHQQSKSVSDASFKAFQQMYRTTKSQEKQVAKNTKGDAVLSWVPVIPYSQKWSNLSGSSAFPNGYLQSNGVLMKDQNDYGTLSGKMLTESSSKDNPLSAGNNVGPQLVAAGDKDAVITDGDSIEKISAVGNSGQNSIEKMVSSGLNGNKNVTGQVYGYDSYGDIINGKTLKVVVPYWNNTTIKGIDSIKDPIVYCPINGISASKMDFSQCGAGDVSNSDIEKIDKKDASTIEKVRDALKSKTAGQSPQKYIESVNNAVSKSDNGSNTKLSQTGAAALAVLITAKTNSQIQAYNKNFIDNTKKAQQLFIGEPINANQVSKDNKNNGIGYYTAADAIQRYCLSTDYGLFGTLRKTITSALVSMYNADFLQTEGQNVFATKVFNAQSEFNRLGSQPYFYIMIFIDIIIGVVTTFQYYRGEVPGSKFITRFLKIFVMILIFALVGIGVIPRIETALLNSPTGYVMNGAIKRESVLDMWDKLREQKTVNNVFYSDLMQDNFGGINRSSNYLIPFYTSTQINGNVDPSVSDPMDPNYAKIQKAELNTVPPQDQMINRYIYRQGDGKVPMLAPYEYKKVYISLMDLTDWASHMTRQVLSAENRPGFQKGDPDYEAPAEGFKPGEEPLFTWLSENYQPIKQSSGSSDQGQSNQSSSQSNSSSANSSSSSSSSSSSNGLTDNANAAVINKVYADADKRSQIIELAKSRADKKVPYKYGGTDWDNGMDCSGFVQQVYQHAGINLPRTSGAQYKWAMDNGGKKESESDAKPGDLVFQPANSGSSHVQIYAGDGYVYEEPQPGQSCHKAKEWTKDVTYVNMSAQIGGAANSSSSSSDSSSSGSKQNGQIGGDTYGDYGSVKNPADTATKSAYNSPYSNDTIDNSEMYKGLDKYSEFTVNTKHYASKDALKYGIDKDSQGTQLTASQAFLHIWENIFYNSGDNADPGDANSLNSLMNFAQAIRGHSDGLAPMPSDQKTSPDVGTDPNNPNINQNTVEQTGRDDLINELSMTQYQRKQLNGGDGRYSTAAQQMIDAYHIPAGKSDYFDLDRKNSIINIMHPYYEPGTRAYDGIIFSINKKMLNDYINDYSTVRADIDPNNANSSDDTGNNQPKQQGVDPLTMAEDQVMAADMFFTINQKLHYRMFPKGYDPHSISLDSYNRMMFIPIAAMKQLNDTSTYDLADKTDAAKIALQDNVAEYIALTNPSCISLLLFLIMNLMLVTFGMILTIFFVVIYVILNFLTLIRYFVLKKGSLKGILVGNLFAICLFSVLKLGLGAICAMSDYILNNSYISCGGFTKPHVLMTSLIVCAYLFFVFKILIRYGSFVFRRVWTLGATDDGHILKDCTEQVFRNNGHANKHRNRLINRWNNRRNYQNKRGILNKLTHHSGHIKRVIKYSIPGRVVRSLYHSIIGAGIISRLSKGHRFLRRKDNNLSSIMDNLSNAPVAGIRSTTNQGLDVDKLKSNGLDNGSLIGKKQAMNSVSYDLGDLINQYPDLADGMLDDIIYKANQNDQGYRYQRLGNNLVVSNDYMNKDMLESPSSRKEIMEPLLNGIYDTVGSDDGILNNLGSQFKRAPHPKYLPLYHNVGGDDNSIALAVDKTTGIDPNKMKKFIRSYQVRKYYDVIESPITRNGKVLSGNLVLRLKDKYRDGLSELKGSLLDHASLYTSKEFKPNFDTTYDSYITTGPDANKFVNNLMEQYPDSNLSEGVLLGNKYYFRSSSSNKVYHEFKDMLSQATHNMDGIQHLNNAVSSYINKGNGYGMNATVDNNDSDVISQFKVNKDQNKVIRGMKTLDLISGIPNIVSKGHQVQSDINQALENSYRGPIGLVEQYMHKARDLNLKIPNRVNDIYEQMKSDESISGTTDPSKYTFETKSRLNNDLRKVHEILKQNGKLNLLQTELISDSNDPNVQCALKEKQDFINDMKPYGISGSDFADSFRNMTIDQIVESSAAVSNVNDMKSDTNNGVLSTKMHKSSDLDITNNRIQEAIRAMSS